MLIIYLEVLTQILVVAPYIRDFLGYLRCRPTTLVIGIGFARALSSSGLMDTSCVPVGRQQPYSTEPEEQRSCQ